MALVSNASNVFPKPEVKIRNDENSKAPPLFKESKQSKRKSQEEKEDMAGEMCLEVLRGTLVSEIAKEIVKNSDTKRSLVFTEYYQKLLKIENDILGKRQYHELPKNKKKEEEKDKGGEKRLKVENRRELSKREEEYIMRNALSYYRHVPFFVENVQSVPLFQQELKAFKEFAGPEGQKEIDKVMAQGFNPIHYIYLFKKMSKIFAKAKEDQLLFQEYGI